MEYSASIMSAAFWYLETRITAEYLLEGLTKEEIMDLSLNENIYQVDSERRKKELVRMCYRRLDGFSEELLEYFINSDFNAGRLIVLISILTTDRLFFEFMYEVFRQHIILGNYKLTRSDYKVFMLNKSAQSEIISNWEEKTKKRVMSNFRQFLSESNLINTEGEDDIINVPFVDFRLRDLLEGDEKLVPYLKAVTGEN